MQKFPYLNISALPPPACCNRCLHAHLITEGREERLKLHDGPVVRLGRSSHRLTAVDMVGQMSQKVLLACAERAGVVDQNWDRGAERAGEDSLPEVKGPLDAVAANMTQEGQWA